MKTVISVVLAALFLVGCSDSSSEAQNVEPVKVVTEVAEAATPKNEEPQVVQESNESAPVETESAPVETESAPVTTEETK